MTEMKIGIVTLVSDNYGNKYQNYAVERLLDKYGEVETFRVTAAGSPTSSVNQTSTLDKLRPSYIKEVIRCRLMGRYDIKNTERSIIGNILYAFMHKNELISAKKRRSHKFVEFTKKYLHVSKRVINFENCNDVAWINQYDCFVCGSDQIWNPTYSTTSELAFLSFAKGKAIALAPSFGLSFIPEDAKEKYKMWLNNLDMLSVREEAGKEIIRELTGRDADVLLDPTMALEVDEWQNMATKPDEELPEQYVVCYFLGRVDKKYKQAVERFARSKGLSVVMLFDIESLEYYTLDPNEVLYCILHADYVLTDSFHGTVFSILFQKNFLVFERNEGVLNMSSRINTLLRKFRIEDNRYGKSTGEITDEQWEFINEILKEERCKTQNYLNNSIGTINNKII